jgi:hypothetical protein
LSFIFRDATWLRGSIAPAAKMARMIVTIKRIANMTQRICLAPSVLCVSGDDKFESAAKQTSEPYSIFIST